MMAHTPNAHGVLLHDDKLAMGDGGAIVEVKLYAYPKSGLNGAPAPTRAEDIGPGATIPDSVFKVELWTGTHPAKPASVASFYETGGTQSVSFVWLHPASKKDPILIYKFGVGDDGDYKILTYAHGIHHAPVIQEAGFGGDEDSMSDTHFDKVDKHGTRLIYELYSHADRPTVRTNHRWTGHRFQGLDAGDHK